MAEDRVSQLERMRSLLKEGAIEQAEYDQLKADLLAGLGERIRVPEGGGKAFGPVQCETLLSAQEGDEIGPVDERFRLEKRIGSGGMGEVWKALDIGESERSGVEHWKALKLLPPELARQPRHLGLLGREADLAKRLSHPHIINIYGLRRGREDVPFIVMDYLEGSDLEVRLSEGPIRWEQALVWMGQVAEALDYAWDEFHLVHRDLKPGNVFITVAGKVKLLDFGLAWQLRQTLSRVSNRVEGSGTPAYMPPEAFVAGPPDRRQDVYALGCMAYQLLTGQLPFDPAATRTRPRELYPPRPEGILEPGWQGIRRALSYDKADRPSSAEELMRSLRPVKDGVPERLAVLEKTFDGYLEARALDHPPEACCEQVLGAMRALAPAAPVVQQMERRLGKALEDRANKVARESAILQQAFDRYLAAEALDHPPEACCEQVLGAMRALAPADPVVQQLERRLGKALGERANKEVRESVYGTSNQTSGQIVHPTNTPSKRLRWIAALIAVAGVWYSYTGYDRQRVERQNAEQSKQRAQQAAEEEARRKTQADRLAAEAQQRQADEKRQAVEQERTRAAEEEARRKTQADRLAAARGAEAPTLARKAEQGDAVAQFELGKKYAEGRGVAQSDIEAVKWYLKAAEQGHAGAKEAMDALEKRARTTRFVEERFFSENDWQKTDATTTRLLKRMISIAVNDGGYGKADDLNELRANIESLPKPANGDVRAARTANELGLSAFRSERYGEAKKHFLEARKSDPRDVEVATNLGTTYLKIGESKEALNQIAEALAMMPGRAVSWSTLAGYYALQDRHPEAAACYALAFHVSTDKEKTKEALQNLSQGKDAAADPRMTHAAQAALQFSPINTRVPSASSTPRLPADGPPSTPAAASAPVVSAIPAVSGPPSSLPTRITTGAGVFLRVEPNRSANRRALLAFGTLLTLLDQQYQSGETWCRVATANGEDGWIPAVYLANYDQQEAIPISLRVAREKLAATTQFADLVEVVNFLQEQEVKFKGKPRVGELYQLAQEAVRKAYAQIPPDQRQNAPYREWIETQSSRPGWRAIESGPVRFPAGDLPPIREESAPFQPLGPQTKTSPVPEGPPHSRSINPPPTASSSSQRALPPLNAPRSRNFDASNTRDSRPSAPPNSRQRQR